MTGFSFVPLPQFFFLYVRLVFDNPKPGGSFESSTWKTFLLISKLFYWFQSEEQHLSRGIGQIHQMQPWLMKKPNYKTNNQPTKQQKPQLTPRSSLLSGTQKRGSRGWRLPGFTLAGQLDNSAHLGGCFCLHLRLPPDDWWLGWKGGSAGNATLGMLPPITWRKFPLFGKAKRKERRVSQSTPFRYLP